MSSLPSCFFVFALDKCHYITGAQEYQIANRRLTKANLSTLYARENSLMAAIARRDGGDLSFAQMGRI